MDVWTFGHNAFQKSQLPVHENPKLVRILNSSLPFLMFQCQNIFLTCLNTKKVVTAIFFLNFFCISKPRRTHLLPYFLVTILLPYGLVFSCNLQTRATIISKTWWFTTP